MSVLVMGLSRYTVDKAMALEIKMEILDCTKAHDLVIANMFFKKRDSHLTTYTSGGRSTQIDYWLI